MVAHRELVASTVSDATVVDAAQQSPFVVFIPTSVPPPVRSLSEKTTCVPAGTGTGWKSGIVAFAGTDVVSNTITYSVAAPLLRAITSRKMQGEAASTTSELIGACESYWTICHGGVWRILLVVLVAGTASCQTLVDRSAAASILRSFLASTSRPARCAISASRNVRRSRTMVMTSPVGATVAPAAARGVLGVTPIGTTFSATFGAPTGIARIVVLSKCAMGGVNASPMRCSHSVQDCTSWADSFIVAMTDTSLAQLEHQGIRRPLSRRPCVQIRRRR